MSKIVDADQRLQALDTNDSFIVQAPAGSGKTGLITQRFLVLLAGVNAPEEIVAITFTRKAAGEMRERLLEALYLGTQPLPSDADPYTQQVWQLANAALERDRDLDWQLLNNPARLRIQTIDSLCASLTRQLPVMAQFGAQPAIADDPLALYREAAQQTLADLEQGEAWSPAIERLLEHLDNNLAYAEDMLVSMLAKRDQWLRHLVNVRHEPDWRGLLELALQNTIEESVMRVSNFFPPMHISSLIDVLDFAANNVPDDHAMACCRGLTDLPDATLDELPQWLGIVELLLKQDNDWRNNPRGLTAKFGFPAPSSAKSDKGLKELLTNKKAAAVELATLLSESAELHQALIDLRTLPAPIYSDNQWQIVEAMCELLLVAVGRLRVVFGSSGKVDFGEMSQSALQALGDDEAPTDLALSLDYRIQHLLVDEFQDTSFGQYALLERLTAGWQPGDGRTLFLVGDPMQSIYRFREAEVGLYLRARREGIGSVSLVPLTLCVNFRSQGGVVEWVNGCFSTIFPQQEDMSVGAVTYSPSTAFHEQAHGDAVTVHPALEHSPQAEARQVVDIVQDALARNPTGSVAVLVRARTHLVDIIAAMKMAGLRYRALEIEQLSHRPVVQDLYVLTRALLHPADRMAWLALLRAPWCGLELKDLELLAGQRGSVIWARMNLADVLEQLSPSGQQRLLRLREVIGEALAARARCGLRRWVESVWLQLGGPACVEGETDLEDAEVFFALLDSLEVAGGLEELTALDESLVKLYALPDVGADERIQIMTIHKSKGLEFDTVILPGLGRRASVSESPMLVWQERWHEAHSELLLAPVRATGEAHDAIYNYIKGVDSRKGEYETGRLLYVAATRARRQLHLLGHTLVNDEGEPKPPQGRSLLSLLWPVVEPEFIEASAQSGLSVQNEVPDSSPVKAELVRIDENWQQPQPASSVTVIDGSSAEQDLLLDPDFLWAGETARHVGTVVHELLQRVAEEGVGQWQGSRVEGLDRYIQNALIGFGVAADELPMAIEKVKQSLRYTVGDQRGQWLLSSDHQEHRCEYAISGVINGYVVRAVIDRTFVDSLGVRWIIDYKTGYHEGGDHNVFIDNEVIRYQPQLERYAQLFALNEERPIKLGLYFPLMQAWREWEYKD